MYETEGQRCDSSGSPAPAPDRLDAPAGRRRSRDVPCPVCGTPLRAGDDGRLPEHWTAPAGDPPPVVHRNDDASPEEARDAGCVACARCDHEPDDQRCFDFCSSPSAGAWLPLAAAWACDSCGCPVVRRETKLPHTGAWPQP